MLVTVNMRIKKGGGILLTLEEFKKINKISNEQLADLIGVSKEKVATMLKGHEIIKDRKKIILRLKDLGIAPPDEEYKIETPSINLNKTITINEFFEESGMTLKGFAEVLGVSPTSLWGWLQGRRASEEICERLEKLGIKHPTYKEKPLRENPLKKKRDDKKGVLKDFQVHAVEKYGNTIVSKRHTKEAIVNEFAKFGLKVYCREFETYRGGHYVVEII